MTTPNEETPPNPEDAHIWVGGIVANRDKQPYIQLATTSGLKAQLTISQARKIAYDILNMCGRTEADAMILKFFDKENFPSGAAAALMMDFREFRHELDMDTPVGFEDDPDHPRRTT